MSEDVRQKEEDPFWEIALNYDGRGGQAYAFDNGNDDDDDDDDDEEEEEDYYHPNLGGRITKYHLPNSSVTLELAPLAAEDGIWSPVGDHAWYSSALLTSLIMQETSIREEKENNDDDDDDGFIDNDDEIIIANIIRGGVGRKEANNGIRVLELGSGAVGLSGIAFAVALSQQQARFPSWTVSLTDIDKTLLKQLDANVRSNIISKNIMLSSTTTGTTAEDSSRNKHIEVEYLDWDLNNDDDDDDVDDDIQNNRDRLLSADVVIGSELAYTRETATALVKILLKLLDKNPKVQIWIVQVTDRYGWSEIVVPALESKKNIKIETIPLSFDVHEMASTLIQMGGALDRFAFGAFRISNTTE